jgi:hypothetical protein
MPGFSADDLARLLQIAKKFSLQTVLDVVIPAGFSVSKAQVETVLPYTDFF